jgi:hypothetical protein
MARGLPWHGNNGSLAPPSPGASKKVDTCDLSFVDLPCHMWISWLDRNALCFRNEDWLLSNVKDMLWKKYLDHGLTAWFHACRIQKLHPARAAKTLHQFDHNWMLNPLFGARICFQVHRHSTVRRSLPVPRRVVSISSLSWFSCTSPGLLVFGSECCLFCKLA